MKDVVMVDNYNAVTTTVDVCFIFRLLYAKAVNRKNILNKTKIFMPPLVNLMLPYSLASFQIKTFCALSIASILFNKKLLKLFCCGCEGGIENYFV